MNARRVLVTTALDEQLEAGVLMVPEQLRDGLLLYLRYGVPTGGFLDAVLSNNLISAVRRGDDVCRNSLVSIVTFLDQYAPAEAFGSQMRVEEWISKGRVLRREQML